MAAQEESSNKGVSRRSFVSGVMAAGAAGVIAEMGARRQAWAAENEGSDASSSETVDASEVEGNSDEAILAATGCSNTNGRLEYPPDTVSEDDIVETIDCDIVIVGAGLSGLAAAMYAPAQGANVHCIEKSSTQGVHRMSVAGINPSFLSEEQGYEETINPQHWAWDAYKAMGGFQTKMPLLTRYAKDSGKWIDWLYEEMKEYGWSLSSPTLGGEGYNVEVEATDEQIWPVYDVGWACVDPDGKSLMTGDSPNYMELFREIAEDNGCNFHFDEMGWYLEREEDGRVTGIITKGTLTGEYRRYNASMGVLLAAGDYFNEKEMLHKYAPFLEKTVMSVAEPNNTGDMAKAAVWVGAAMDDVTCGDLFALETATCKDWVGPREGDDDYTPLLDSTRAIMWVAAGSGLPICLWVDDGGRRFVNEDMNVFQLTGGVTEITTPTGLAWSIWDSEWESKLPDDWADRISPFLNYWSVNTQNEMDIEVEEGLIQKYDTIEELCEGCGFDVDYFTETLDRYNYLAERGEDLDCYKASDWLKTIDTPPYYAAHWGCMCTSTRCGVKTDEHSRVIDTEGQIIPGLYAAGNNGGNFYGINYPGSFGGSGIGHGQFFAWTAVRDMLGEDVIYTEED